MKLEIKVLPVAEIAEIQNMYKWSGGQLPLNIPEWPAVACSEGDREHRHFSTEDTGSDGDLQ